MSGEIFTNQPDQKVGYSDTAKALLNELQKVGFSVGTWKDVSVNLLYEKLEKPNWAPWLEASPESIAGRASFFPDGQLVLLDQKKVPVASLSTNLIEWDGNPHTLPTWDEIAGDPTDYSTTFTPGGNTLVLMSMNVDPTLKGNQLPAKLTRQAQLNAQVLGVEYLIGSFRPSEFGENKKSAQKALSFWEYVADSKVVRTDKDGVFGSKGAKVELPKDKWLRSLAWMGMQPIIEDTNAMIVTVSLEEFSKYKSTYFPESWWKDQEGAWHCSEVGSWEVDLENNSATYRESNVFGSLPLIK